MSAFALPSQNRHTTWGQRLERAFHGYVGPFAFVDLEAFDANAQALLARSSKPIRLATKSVRSVPLIQRALELGFRGLMCFSVREAVQLAQRGFDDLLVAYPSVDSASLTHAAHWVAQGKTIRLMVDSEAQLPMLRQAARAAGTVLAVCLDLDVSQDYPALRFGMHRSPLSDAASVLRLAAAIARYPELRLVGLMGYEGQVAGVPDANHAGPVAKQWAIRWLKGRARAQVAQKRAEVVNALQKAGHELLLVNAGGTGSLESSSAEPHVTEVSAGSGLLAPMLFDGYEGFRLRPAAGFALNVVRQPSAHMVTCLGGGYAASGPAGTDRLPTPIWPTGLQLLPLEGAGEVQTPLRVPAGVSLSVGDLVFFRHAKAGELCEHFQVLHGLNSPNVVTQTLPTYRGEGWTFP